ncbi:hypothetical protein ACVHNB_12575 [Streptomyces sp. YJ-C3]
MTSSGTGRSTVRHRGRRALDESPVRDTAEKVTGRAPRSFARRAGQHAHAFAG